MAVSDNDVIQQVIDFVASSGDHFQNKFTWKYGGSTYPDASVIGSMDTWAEDFYEIVAASMLSSITAFTSEYDVIEWNDVEGFWEVVRNIGHGSGIVTFTNTSEQLPFQVAPCLVGFTTKPKSRGRKWIPLFCEDTQNSSVWTSGTETALAALLVEYLLGHIMATGHGMEPGVASKKWEIFLPFVSGMVQNLVFTQRRRTRGRGT